MQRAVSPILRSYVLQVPTLATCTYVANNGMPQDGHASCHEDALPGALAVPHLWPDDACMQLCTMACSGRHMPWMVLFHHAPHDAVLLASCCSMIYAGEEVLDCTR